jgi:hypothetical protein
VNQIVGAVTSVSSDALERRTKQEHDMKTKTNIKAGVNGGINRDLIRRKA